MFSTNYRGSFVHKAVSIISLFVLVAGISPTIARASTIFSEDFGTGSSANDISLWEESGSDSSATTRATAASTGNDSVSPNGGRFAVIGMDEWICRSVSTTGYNTLTMSYVWRGDDSAENNDFGRIEYKIGGSCEDSNGWTALQSHDMSIDSSWSTQSAISLPNALNNTTFNLRVRADSSNNGEDFRIDGITINGSVIVADTDGDGVADTTDNCPSVLNANQANNDNDSQGDLCDTDDDNDTIVDTTDNCPMVANAGQENIDNDSLGDACDPINDNPVNTAPTVTLVGNAEVTITVGGSYTESGATWSDAQDGSGSATISGSVNTTLVGDYVLTYSYTDAGGLSDSETRTVHVIALVCDEGQHVEGNTCVDDVDEPSAEETLCEQFGGEWNGITCIGIEHDILCDVFGTIGEFLNIPFPDCDEEGGEEQPVDTDADSIPDVTDNCDSTANADQADSDEDGIGDVCDSNEGEEEQNENPVEESSNETPKSGGSLNKACNNSEDDDNDGLYDVNDPDCENASDNSEGGIGGTSEGEVLGAASCSAILDSYIGLRNITADPEDVKVLQAFLNKELGLSLEVNGEYDAATKEAVKAFQKKYLSDVLTPWGINESTGIVYKTTQRMINKIACPSLDIPMPVLN